VTGVFLAGIVGGLAMGGGPGGVRSTIVAAAGFGDAATTTVTATRDSRTSAARSTRSGTAPPAPGSKTYLRGEILDASGAPVSGLYVYSGHLTSQGFVPNKSPARTNGVGWYMIACTGGPLLVTSWPINRSLGPAAGGAYAARFVDTPSCGLTKHHVVTRVEEGAVVRADRRAGRHHGLPDGTHDDPEGRDADSGPAGHRVPPAGRLVALDEWRQRSPG
jgi:hypothetical protein